METPTVVAPIPYIQSRVDALIHFLQERDEIGILDAGITRRLIPFGFFVRNVREHTCRSMATENIESRLGLPAIGRLRQIKGQV